MAAPVVPRRTLNSCIKVLHFLGKSYLRIQQNSLFYLPEDSSVTEGDLWDPPA